jgi:hypothetical protein
MHHHIKTVHHHITQKKHEHYVPIYRPAEAPDLHKPLPTMKEPPMTKNTP